jgi:hypothetical protein
MVRGQPRKYPPGESHRKSSREYQARIRKERSEKELCLRCGKPAHRDMTGRVFSLCHPHMVARAEYKRMKARERGVKPRYPNRD